MSSRFSEIGHDGIVLWNPLPEDETFRLLDAIPVAADEQVLDVGCGRAALLVRLLSRTGASGVGVDPWEPSIEAARAAARQRSLRLEFVAERFDAAGFGARRFDVALCIGSTHAAGGLRGTLRALHALVRPGGVVLVGEGHWIREPDPAYLAFLGDTRESLLDREGTLTAFRGAGFVPERAIVSSQRDFDRYEERHAANVERFAAEHPGDPDAAPFLRRIRAWREAYLRWGRDTLGFSLDLLRREP